MLHFSFYWAMHLGLHTPSLCGTVNLAGDRVTVSVVTHGNNEMNQRDEREATSARFYSRELWTRNFREDGAGGIRVSILADAGSSSGRNGFLACCPGTVCCCSLTDKLCGSRGLQAVPSINERRRNLFQSRAEGYMPQPSGAEHVPVLG